MADRAAQLALIKARLDSHALFQAVLKRSLRFGKKIPKVEIFIPSRSKYNQPTSEEIEACIFAPNHPRENGHYDVEGLSSCDFYGYYRLNLLNFKDLRTYLNNIAVWIKEIWTYKSWTYTKDTCPILFPWSTRTWMLTSFQSAKYGLASYRAERIVARQRLGMHDAIRREMEIESQILPTLTTQDVAGYLALDLKMIQINSYLWVYPDNPTYFYVNDSVIPFDCKDGWSDRVVMFLLADWFEALGYTKPIVVARPERYSVIFRDLKRAVLRFLRNDLT